MAPNKDPQKHPACNHHGPNKLLFDNKQRNKCRQASSYFFGVVDVCLQFFTGVLLLPPSEPTVRNEVTVSEVTKVIEAAAATWHQLEDEYKTTMLEMFGIDTFVKPPSPNLRTSPEHILYFALSGNDKNLTSLDNMLTFFKQRYPTELERKEFLEADAAEYLLHSMENLFRFLELSSFL